MAEIISLAVGILELVTKVVGFAASPIKKQLNYMCCYGSNIDSLQKEGQKLDNLKGALQLSVDAATRNVEVIAPDVKDWLQTAEENKTQRDNIAGEIANVKEGCCPNFTLRYSVSRKAKKMTEEAEQLQRTGNFQRISYPPPPMGLRSVPSSAVRVKEFESRKAIEKAIIEAITKNGITSVGIRGMGGVGKTRMAERIGKSLIKQDRFAVVMAVVGQQPKKEKIQNAIADGLGLTLPEGDNLMSRANLLSARLNPSMAETGLVGKQLPILIILDDVWERLDLEEIFGISPQSESPWYKIMVTSRDTRVLQQMEIQRSFEVPILRDNEAWTLFKEKAGNCIESANLNEIVKSVATECRGLPVAIVTLGRAMKDNQSEPSWRDALQQLRTAIPDNISGLSNDVYKPLQLSYDKLEDNQAKNLFLLCCLFPENFYINPETLVEYGMALDIFNGVRNLEMARNRVYRLIETLKQCNLLMEDSDNKVHKAFKDFLPSSENSITPENAVFMHDLVRDVCVYIASNTNPVSIINHEADSRAWPAETSSVLYGRMSILSREMAELPKGLSYPNLELLILEADGCKELPDDFFDGLRNLKILDLYNMNIQVLPSSLESLANVRTLHLARCKLGDITMIGKLVNLEILVFRHAHIKDLPAEIGKLAKLRLLDLTGCQLLEIIAPDVISNLSGLEDLRISKSIIKDVMVVSSQATIGTDQKRKNKIVVRELNRLVLKDLHNLIGFCKSGEVDCIEFPQLSQLTLGSSRKLKSFCPVGEDSGTLTGDRPLFDNKISCDKLDTLTLQRLPNVTKIFSDQLPIKFFGTLKALEIVSCDKLRSLISGSVARNLLTLQNLKILNCRKIESIIENDNGDRSTMALLPKLQHLELSALPRLIALCDTNYSLKFPSLEKLILRECLKLDTNALKSLKMPMLVSLEAHVHALQHLYDREVPNNLNNNSDLLLPPTDLSIIREDSGYWDWHLFRESSNEKYFEVTAELRAIWRLEIEGKINTSELCCGTTYEALFVVKLGPEGTTDGWDLPVNLKLIMPDGTVKERPEDLMEKPRGEWMELLAGEFKVTTNYSESEVKFSLYEHGGHWKKGLSVKGVILRPTAAQGHAPPDTCRDEHRSRKKGLRSLFC